MNIPYTVVKMREELGRELRHARSGRGLSLEVASQAAKISQGYLHKLEAGRVENPSPRVLQRLSGVLDVPYGRLMALCDYLLPTDRVQANPTEAAIPTTSHAVQAPTNQELARLLEAVLAELSQLRRGQDELTQSLRTSHHPEPGTQGAPSPPR